MAIVGIVALGVAASKLAVGERRYRENVQARKAAKGADEKARAPDLQPK
jgi:hypothetical protein